MLYFFLDGIVFKILSSNASHPCLLSFVHPFSAGENQYFQLFLSFLNWKYYNVIELDLLNTICKSLLHWSPVWFLYAPMFDVLKWCVPTFGWEQPIVTLPKIVWEILKKPLYRVPLFSRSQETAVSHVRTNLPNAHKGQVILPGLKHMSI